MRAIALDFEHAQLSARGLPFQLEARSQRGETLPCLIEILVVLLGLDGCEHLVLQHFELEVRHFVRGLLAFAVVFHAAGLVLGPFLGDLLDEIVVFRGLLERELVLVLSIEFGEDIAARDMAARKGEVGDDQGLPAAAGLKGRHDHVGTRGLGEARDAQGAHEFARAEWMPAALRGLGEGRRGAPGGCGAPGEPDRGADETHSQRSAADALREQSRSRTRPVGFGDGWERHESSRFCAV